MSEPAAKKMKLEVETVILEEKDKWTRVTRAEELVAEEGEAVVKVGSVGVCGTDFHAFHGNQPLFSYPRVIGHELGVEVVSVGSGVTNVTAGQKCCVEPYIDCGKCIACKRGKGNCCQNLKVLGVHIDGGLRSYFKLPARKLHPSSTLSMEQLAVVEPLCIGAHSVYRAGPVPGEAVLIIGAGPVGMGAAQFAVAEGASVCCMDINDQRLQFVKEQVGVQHTVNAISKEGEASIDDRVKALFEGELPTCVIEATGNVRSMEKAFEFVNSGGRIVFVGHTKQRISYDNPLFHTREMTVMGSRNALPSDFARTVKLIEEGKVDVSPWVTHRKPFTDFDMEKDFDFWLNPENKCIKALINLA